MQYFYQEKRIYEKAFFTDFCDVRSDRFHGDICGLYISRGHKIFDFFL